MIQPNTQLTPEQQARIFAELERRKKTNPLNFVEPPNNKILEFWKSTKKVRAIFGGNRSGKTESALIDVLWHLRGDHPYQRVPSPPVYWRCEVVDYNQLEKVLIPKLSKLVPTSLLKGGSWEKSYNSRTHIITFANGSRLDFVTHDLNVLALEGAALHGYWADEEPPKEHYISNVMRTIDYGGKVILSLTPLQGITWVYNEIYLPSLSKPDEIFTVNVSIYENKFLSQTEIEEIEKLVTDETDREIRLYGRFKPLGGLVFRKFDPEIHVYEQPPSFWDNDFPPNWYIHVVGIDPGWSHPTGIIWLAVDPETGDHYFYDEHKASQMLPEEHAEIIKAKNQAYGIDPIFVIDAQANATRENGTQLINDYRKAGISPRLGTKKLLAGNQHLDRLMNWTVDPYGNFETKFHVSKQCSNFITELMTYQRKMSSDDEEKFIDKENDLISAARYAAWVVKDIEWNPMLKAEMTKHIFLPAFRKFAKQFEGEKKQLKTGY